MEFSMWANLHVPRHVGQLTPMRGKLAHVYLPYKSHNFVNFMGVLYVFFWQKHEQKGWSFNSDKTSDNECYKLPWYLKM